MKLFEAKYHTVELNNLSFLVTGGAGFIGSNIAEYLLRFGAKKVRVLDNFITGKKSNIDRLSAFANFEFIEGDITDLETCQKACAGVDFVSHQAALGSVPRSLAVPFDTNNINVNGFVNMAFAAKENHVKRFVYASSSSVYGDEKRLPKIESQIGKQLSPYAVSKYANELYASVFSSCYDLKFIGLRYFNIFGYNQDPNGQYAAVIPLFIKGISTAKDVYIDGDGEQTRDFTFVENAVQANIRAMLNDNPAADNQVYNIACGDRFSVNDIFFEIAALLHSSQKPIYRETRKGDVRDSLADISKAQTLLGYQPLFDFKTGIQLTVENFDGFNSNE